MKNIFFTLAALLTISVASAQTDNSATKKQNEQRTEKKDKTSKADKEKKTAQMNDAKKDRTTTPEQATPAGVIPSTDDPTREGSSVANPNGMNSPSTTTTSPGSTASPTGNQSGSQINPTTKP